MNYTDFYNFAKGKTGYIYAARQGSVLIVVIDGKSYMLSTTADNGKVVENHVPDYWCHSIEHAGGFTDYFTFGMVPGPDELMPYPARPIIPITDTQRAKLSSLQSE